MLSRDKHSSLLWPVANDEKRVSNIVTRLEQHFDEHNDTDNEEVRPMTKFLQIFFCDMLFPGLDFFLIFHWRIFNDNIIYIQWIGR